MNEFNIYTSWMCLNNNINNSISWFLIYLVILLSSFCVTLRGTNHLHLDIIVCTKLISYRCTFSPSWWWMKQNARCAIVRVRKRSFKSPPECLHTVQLKVWGLSQREQMCLNSQLVWFTPASYKGLHFSLTVPLPPDNFNSSSGNKL